MSSRPTASHDDVTSVSLKRGRVSGGPNKREQKWRTIPNVDRGFLLRGPLSSHPIVASTMANRPPTLQEASDSYYPKGIVGLDGRLS